MNDLTREDLETLLVALSVYEKRVYPLYVHTPLTDLLKKLNKMIESDCAYDKSISFYHCGICKEDFCLTMNCQCFGEINDE